MYCLQLWSCGYIFWRDCGKPPPSLLDWGRPETDGIVYLVQPHIQGMASGYGGLYAERGFASWVRPWPTLGETIVNVVTFANSCNAYIPIEGKEAACRIV